MAGAVGLGVHDGPADRGAGAQGGGAGRQAGDFPHRDHGLLHPPGRHRRAARRQRAHAAGTQRQVRFLIFSTIYM